MYTIILACVVTLPAAALCITELPDKQMKRMFLKNTFCNDNCFLSLKYVGILQCFLLGFLSYLLWQKWEKKVKVKKWLLKNWKGTYC